MPGRGIAGRLVRSYEKRRNMRRLWGDAGKGLLPPPPGDFGAFGHGSYIIPPARVQAPEAIRIGERVVLHEHVWLCVVPGTGEPPLLEIGDGTSVNRFVKIVCAGRVSIGAECLIGDHVFIADTHYRYDDPNLPIREQDLAPPRPVVIGDGCHIGVRAMIGPGVTIGEHAYVGAGAFVTEDVPARSVAVGHPARVIRRYDERTNTWVATGDDSTGLMA
jgi:acetyltransferase-like isoleucine patch superfamily enzyme